AAALAAVLLERADRDHRRNLLLGPSNVRYTASRISASRWPNRFVVVHIVGHHHLVACEAPQAHLQGRRCPMPELWKRVVAEERSLFCLRALEGRTRRRKGHNPPLNGLTLCAHELRPPILAT